MGADVSRHSADVRDTCAPVTGRPPLTHADDLQMSLFSCKSLPKEWQTEVRRDAAD